MQKEHGRVNFCKGVVSYGCGELGAGMEVVVGRHAGQNQGVLVACREMPELLQNVR